MTPACDLAIVCEDGLAANGDDAQDSVTVDFPNGTVRASRETSPRENSDESPRNDLPQVDENGNEPMSFRK